MWGSCGLTGYFQLEWLRGWEEIDISVKELVPVVVAAALWGGLWRGKHICFHLDNMVVVSILSIRTAKSPHLMHLLRCFSFYCAFYCVNVSCVHVPGAMNAAADALSRNKLPLFSSLVPQALPFPIPASLVGLLVTSRPDWGSQAWTELFVRSIPGGRWVYIEILCSREETLPHIFVHSLIAVHCLLLNLPSCDSLQIYYHWVSHTKQIVDTCVMYTTFKLFITYLIPLLGILPLAELCSSGSSSRCLWKKATHSFTDLPIFTWLRRCNALGSIHGSDLHGYCLC